MKNTSSDVGFSYLNPTAVIAGALIAFAISLILIPFGNAIGLSVNSSLKPENARWVVLCIGLWLLWTQLISSIIGGYFTGRSVNSTQGTKLHETEFRDGVHGLLSWALATILAIAGATLVTFFTALAANNNVDTTSHQVMSLDLTRNTKIILSFATAASSIISAAAAWWMAVLGGEHRDKSVDFSQNIYYRKSKSKRS